MKTEWMFENICRVKYGKSCWDLSRDTKDQWLKERNTNVESNIKIMDRMTDEISKQIGIPITYSGAFDSEKVTWYIRTSDLFPNQEDWELLNMFYNEYICKIYFPNTYLSYESFYFYTDPNGEYKYAGTTWTSIPHVVFANFNHVSFENMKYEIHEDPETVYNHNSLLIPINKGTKCRYYAKHDFTTQISEKRFYPYDFSIMNGTDRQKMKLMSWENKIITSVVKAYNIYKDTIEQIKPFALDLKRSVELQNKCIENIQRKMKIIFYT